MRVPAVLFLAALIPATEAIAGCVDSNRSPGQPVDYNAVRLVPHNIPSNRMGPFRNGFGAWNDSSCNTEGYSFPYFTESAQGTGRTISVTYFTGFAENEQSCGNYNSTTSEIKLYEKSRTPEGAIRSCIGSLTFEDTVAHELGHVLGLNNQPPGGGCGSYIMAPAAFTTSGTYVNRTVKSSECAMVRDTNNTPQEEIEADCEANPNDCPTCNPQVNNCGSPIVLDLDNTGFEFTNTTRGVLFDIDADGFKEETAWISRRSEDVFLALDRNGNGLIDGANELFGDSTPFQNGEVAENGYQVLFELDIVAGNENGHIDPGDEIFDRLVLWWDGNHNGLSERDELSSLHEAGVVAIAVAYEVSTERDQHGNYLQLRSFARVRDEKGETRTIDTVDVFFLFNEVVGEQRRW